MISSVFLFLSVIFLPKYIKIMSMIFGMGVSNIVLTILNLSKIKKLTNYESKIINKITTQMLIVMPVIWITKITYDWLHIISGQFISMMICSIISTITYFMLLFIFNVINPKAVINFMNKTLKHKLYSKSQ